MSGWEVCRKIRQNAALAHTGVLMLTGIGENLNEATSPLFGADEYIDKPFDFEKLDEKVFNVLERRSAQREAVPRRPSGDQSTGKRVQALGNGIGGPAKAAPRANQTRKKRAAGVSSRAPEPATLRKQTKPAVKKGKKSMAAKKAAKKTAKKAAKKTAKKAAKKTAKKAAKKTAKKGKKR
jgi:CheY-like chemotaxis protein